MARSALLPLAALLRSHLDEIVYRLQNSLRFDSNEEKLPENFPFLLKSIRDSATQEVSEQARRFSALK